MSLFWRIHNNYKNNFILDYDQVARPYDILKYAKGQFVNEPDFLPFHSKEKSESLKKYDCLSSALGLFAVSAKFSEIISQWCGSDVQLIPVVVKAKDGAITDYCVLNPCVTVRGINLDKSKCLHLPENLGGGCYGFEEIAMFDHDFINGYHIAREEAYKQFMYISDGLAEKLASSSKQKLGFYRHDRMLP